MEVGKKEEREHLTLPFITKERMKGQTQVNVNELMEHAEKLTRFMQTRTNTRRQEPTHVENLTIYTTRTDKRRPEQTHVDNLTRYTQTTKDNWTNSTSARMKVCT